jgi:signal transduction histidine kinase/purine-cytosine permease-like protein/DNA-binding NarL/FixJ family response regulator
MHPDPAGSEAAPAIQRVVKVRRDYNTWVANESVEDYALRFTPRGFRKWSELRVANTAFGAASFLVLEAVGATLLVNYGFVNAALAILVTGLIIFVAGLPISYYAARYGLDMDLLTRGAGFGYIGSTLTSLIYASFTFIFFALEAAIMAYALDLAFGIPPAWGYLICALVVIPLVTHGITAISRLQTLTQPLWLVLLVLPYAYVFSTDAEVLRGILHYGGASGRGGEFDLLLFGGALTVGIALFTQMGEQADYLRFMPEPAAGGRGRWWAALLVGGPGWVVLGVVKMLGGALLAYLAISHAVPVERAVDPNQIYLAGYEYVFPHPGWAVAATAIFVVISQLKINVTNAYAGSLAWSNFFARLTHSHPGRVVWVVFNTLIGLVLMELDVFQALGQVLGLYSNVAIAWMMAVVADLVVNKPLGLSPPGIEFKRAHLYDVNPVGVGAMGIASLLSVTAFMGVFGPLAQAFSAVIAMVTAFVAAPLIAWATGGRYYIARQAEADSSDRRCVICDKVYEADDMARCPAYGGPICSLCCALDARCDDLCKPQARLSSQWLAALRRLLPRVAWPYLDSGLAHYLLVMAGIVPLLGLLFGVLYYRDGSELAQLAPAAADVLAKAFLKAFAALVLVSAVVAWWLVLTHKSRQVAQEESNRQTHLLMREIESHQRTDELLQKAKQAADLANQAKSRYITAISHELRTPLNSILGYAQIMDGDRTMPAHRRQAVEVIRRSGDHLLSLIEGTLDIARIEGGKLTLEPRPLDFPGFLGQIVGMFELQARNKGLEFRYLAEGDLPALVRADERRLRQILINVLGNAVKFTQRGTVTLAVRFQREMATFRIDDTGPGIGRDDLDRIFEPFTRGDSARGSAGTGLGLTISRMLTDVMGGEMKVDSRVGEGSSFVIRLFLPQLQAVPVSPASGRGRPVGYHGERRRILVVDNERVDRELLVNLLAPLGFELDQAASGAECLEVVPRFAPDLVFMDLAMPGMDGWETIRHLRRELRCNARVAIISANAFDKALENDVGLPAEDFITKPVRVAELLDWIGEALGLDWEFDAPVVPAVKSDAGQEIPGADDLAALDELAGMGYLRGILDKLNEIDAQDARYGPFVERLRLLARRFEFDEIRSAVGRRPHDPA